MRVSKLKGLVAAPFTPFDASGDVKLSIIETLCELLVNNGVTGAFVCGTTGEGMLLTQEERLQVAERWVEVAGDSVKVLVHVGHNSQRSAIELARHAGETGADAIAAMAPTFFKPMNVNALIDFLAPIAAAASQTPFYYYNIPSMTGVSLSVVDFLQAARGRIPNLAGVKFTHGDLMEYVRCRNLAEGFYDMAWGVDEMLLGGLANGAVSAVGSTYNYAAPLYTKLIRAFEAGNWDVARDCTAKSVEMIAPLLKFGGLRTGKATMAMIGVDCGLPRSPIMPLTPAELASIRQAYEQIGFFDWASVPVRSSVTTTAI